MTSPSDRRLPRVARATRVCRISAATTDTAVTVDEQSGRVELWAWDLTGEGRGVASLELGPRSCLSFA